MIKQSIVNFFKNLKYFFTPLGALFLGILFGVCFLFGGFKVQVKQASSEIREITKQADIDFNELKDCVVDSFVSLSWDDPIDAIRTITSKDWIDGTLKINLENTIENYQHYAKDIEKSVSSAIKGYVKYIVGFVFCAVLGLVGGFVLTKFLIRRNIAKRNVFKLILATLLDSLFTLITTALTLWLAFLWKPNIVIVSILGIVFFGFIALLEAYLVQGNKKLPLKQVVNLKNVFTLTAANLIIYAISFAISALIIAITNAFVGAFIALPLFVVGIIVISLNAEAYVKVEAEKIGNKS